MLGWCGVGMAAHMAKTPLQRTAPVAAQPSGTSGLRPPNTPWPAAHPSRSDTVSVDSGGVGGWGGARPCRRRRRCGRPWHRARCPARPGTARASPRAPRAARSRPRTARSGRLAPPNSRESTFGGEGAQVMGCGAPQGAGRASAGVLRRSAEFRARWRGLRRRQLSCTALLQPPGQQHIRA